MFIKKICYISVPFISVLFSTSSGTLQCLPTNTSHIIFVKG